MQATSEGRLRRELWLHYATQLCAGDHPAPHPFFLARLPCPLGGGPLPRRLRAASFCRFLCCSSENSVRDRNGLIGAGHEGSSRAGRVEAYCSSRGSEKIGSNLVRIGRYQSAIRSATRALRSTFRPERSPFPMCVPKILWRACIAHRTADVAGAGSFPKHWPVRSKGVMHAHVRQAGRTRSDTWDPREDVQSQADKTMRCHARAIWDTEAARAPSTR